MSRRVMSGLSLRLCWMILPLSLLMPGAALGEVDLHRNGDPSDHPIVWYSAIGMAVRDVVRQATGQCYQHVGEIVICKKRDSNSFRIPRNLPRSWPPRDDAARGD
jgi:hypothetical protein